MIAKIEPYLEVQDSGVPWLGDVPAHWRVERAKWLFRKVDRAVQDLDEVVTCFRDGTVTLRRNRRVRGFTEAVQEAGYQGIRRGDLVIHAMDAFAGAIGVADSDGKGTPVYSVCAPRAGANPHYYAYALREMARRGWIEALARGIRERSTDFRFDEFARQPLPVPPTSEQTAIVRFLDHADARIRRFIHTKQAMLKLLDEQKRTIIHHAVTRGLDSSVQLKPSGLEWSSEFPEHWDLVPNRAVMTLKKRVVGDAAGQFTLLSLTKRGVIARDLDNPEGKFPSSFYTYQEIEPGDLVFCLFDIDETPRAVGISSLHGMITGAYTRFACDPEVADWAYLYYLAMDNGKRLKPLYSGLRKVITKSRFLSAKMPLPPRAERAAILKHIDEAVGEADAVAERVHAEIELLREYRTRLIAEVVTGKFDVREAAERLPDDIEAADDEDLDDEVEAFEDDLHARREEVEV